MCIRDRSQEYAEHVPDTAGVYIVPAFAGMGAPYWDQYARGTIVGKMCIRDRTDTIPDHYYVATPKSNKKN